MEYHEPTTFEEWVEIHGEPDYIIPTQAFFTPAQNSLPVTVQDCSCEETPVDTSGTIYQDKSGKLAINYGKFADAFIATNRLVYSNGIFYTPQGAVSASSIRKDITDSIQATGWAAKLDSPTNSLLQTIKDKTAQDNFLPDPCIIPLRNGDLHILREDYWEFHQGELTQTPYRLPVDYSSRDAPMPLFQKWLNDIFDKDDQVTLQQILGYLLMPVTKAQEAFFLVGEGGVGKSVLGVILESLFGNAYTSISTGELVSRQFQLSQAENRLVLYDDDLGTAALTETSTLKKLITADQAIPAERKFADPYNFRSYARIVACANFMLSSLYDDSDGFWRRLHPIQVLPKDKNRKTIRNFGQLIAEKELPQILRWALHGLRDLIANNWEVYWSDRSLNYLGKVRTEGNYIAEFIEDCLQSGEDGDVTSAELLDVYLRWCKDNGTDPVSGRKFQSDFKKIIENDTVFIGTGGVHFNVLDVNPSNLVYRNDKRLRGFKGISVKNEWKITFKVK